MICPSMGSFPCLFTLRFLVISTLIVTPFVTSLSFDFDSFSTDDQNVTYERDAFRSSGAIQLTRNRGLNSSIGRATYSKPLHLWDKASGNVTDFTTHFTFSINSQGRTSYGDGIAFFLAPNGSTIPENTTIGGSLGLTSDSQQVNTSSNPFVAVEFDTYQNEYDPENDHVGIDINSMESVVYEHWFSSIPDGGRTDAWISYDSTSKNLTVAFTGFFQILGNTVPVQQTLFSNLDLKEYLPEWVTFGFTGATGDSFELQNIYSWNFTSSLDDNEEITFAREFDSPGTYLLAPAGKPERDNIAPLGPAPNPKP